MIINKRALHYPFNIPQILHHFDNIHFRVQSFLRLINDTHYLLTVFPAAVSAQE